MKHNHTSVIVRIILWTLTALILLGVLLCGMGVLPGLSIRGFSFGGWNFHYSDSAKYEVGNGPSRLPTFILWKSTGSMALSM